MSERWTARLRYSAVTLAVFFTAYNLRLLLFRWEAFDRFYRAYPWQVGETVWKTLWVVLAVAGVMVTHRVRSRVALREVGLACAPGRALALAFLAAAPCGPPGYVSLPESCPTSPEVVYLGSNGDRPLPKYSCKRAVLCRSAPEFRGAEIRGVPDQLAQ